MKKTWPLPALAALTAALLLSGCQQGIAQTSAHDEVKVSGADVVTQGVDRNFGVSVDENGLFFMRPGDPLLRFYEYDTGKEAVLCDKAACTHSGKGCNAYVPETDLFGGYACYRGTVYLARRAQNADTLDLISMDLGGNDRKSLASIPAGEDGWTLESVDAASYAEGFAWLKVSYGKPADGGESERAEQLFAIDLAAGKVYPLTDRVGGGARAEFEVVGSGHAIYQLIQGSKGTIWLFDTAEKKETIFWEGTLTDVFRPDDPGTLWYQAAPYLFEGIWGDKLVYDGAYQTGGEGSELYTYDLETKETAPLLTVENGGVMGRYMNGFNNMVYGDGQFYYLVYEGEDKCVIHRYDLDTGKDTPLFTDDRAVSFRVTSETSDKLVGTMNEGRDICWIRKADYEKGDLSAAVVAFSQE